MKKYAPHLIPFIMKRGNVRKQKKEVRLFSWTSFLLLDYVFILHNCAKLHQEIRADFLQFAVLRKQQLL
jgi:hypothetical protein